MNEDEQNAAVAIEHLHAHHPQSQMPPKTKDAQSSLV
jgi:hypothetical protein